MRIANRSILRVLLAAATPLAAAACTVNGALAHSPQVRQGMQIVSAGHTGCVPAANQISAVHLGLDGSGTWQATCAGKTYLCSAFLGVNSSESYSCAPAVAAGGTDPP